MPRACPGPRSSTRCSRSCRSRRARPAATSPASCSGATTRSRRSASSRVASGAASSWPSSGSPRPTCSSSTSRRTTSTSSPARRSRRSSGRRPPRSSSSPTTAASSRRSAIGCGSSTAGSSRRSTVATGLARGGGERLDRATRERAPPPASRIGAASGRRRRSDAAVRRGGGRGRGSHADASRVDDPRPAPALEGRLSSPARAVDAELTRLNLRKNHLELAMGDPGVQANFVELRRITSELADVEVALSGRRGHLAGPRGAGTVTVRIGITGPIGCGKSTVAGWLAELGATRHRCRPRCARRSTSRASPRSPPCWSASGRRSATRTALDRAALGRMVFADPTALAAARGAPPAGVRPRILARSMRRRTAGVAVAVEAIKLVGAASPTLCDEVWLVTCARDVQRRASPDGGRPPRRRPGRIAAQARLVETARPRATRVIDTQRDPRRDPNRGRRRESGRHRRRTRGMRNATRSARRTGWREARRVSGAEDDVGARQAPGRSATGRGRESARGGEMRRGCRARLDGWGRVERRRAAVGTRRPGRSPGSGGRTW